MESLTGLTGFYWILFFGYALGLVLAVESLRREPKEAERVGRLLAVPLVAGVLLTAFLVLSFRAETRFLLRHLADRPGSVPVALVSLLTAVAFVDLYFARFVVLAGRALSRVGLSPRNRADVSLVLGIGLPVLLLLAAFPRIHDHFADVAPEQEEAARTSPEVGRAAAGTVVQAYELPGHPLDIELQTPTSGYVSFGEGTIARFELPEDADGELRVTPVARRLRYPRGLAISGGKLFVAELGRLPCGDAVLRCKGGVIDGETVDETEKKILRTSRARVLSFDIRPNGLLSNPRPLLSDLPVANTDHGLNDVFAGPGGRLYLSIGHLDAIYAEDDVELRRELSRPRAGLLGTIVSFRPDGSDVEVHVRGLRNLYGITSDRRGQLYGTDNSGPTRNGAQPEELLRIEAGADYGYPEAPKTRSTPPSLQLLEAGGSAGIGWVPGPGEAGRLLVGTCGDLFSVQLARGSDGEARVVRAAGVTQVLADVPACVTSIQARPGGVVAALFSAGGRIRGYLVTLTLPTGP